MYLYVTIKSLYDYYKNQEIETKKAIEKATNEPTLILPYEKVSIDFVKELKPKAIILGGFYESFESFEAKQFINLYEVIEKVTIPMLCICGSHQLLGKFYNEDIYKTERFYDDPIRKLTEQDDGPFLPGERSEFYYAHGFYKIHKEKKDPIFEDLPDNMILKCLHYAEIKKLPEQFECIASSKHSKIEAIKHKEKILYGLGFHAEKYEYPFMDGEKILKNFAHIVEQFWTQNAREIE